MTSMRISKKSILLLTMTGLLGGFATGIGLADVNEQVHALVTDPQPTEVEKKNSSLATQVAEDGMVLLQNKNSALPISSPENIALFGAGAYGTYYGGTGSGSVSSRHSINIWDGLKEQGYTIASEKWLNNIKADYDKKKSQAGDNTLLGSFKYSDPVISDSDFKDAPADTGIYVVSRSAGEGSDRKNEQGDYQLTDNEKQNIKNMASHYSHSIVLLNTGAQVDTNFIQEDPKLDSVLLVSQAGQNTGKAAAELISGQEDPSGKLTATWAKNYSDYPSSKTFSDNDRNSLEEKYGEGIYVGYRYFDSYNITPNYEFGYGRSYTDFSIKADNTNIDDGQVNVNATVKNTGKRYSGKEVVQLYYSVPKSSVPSSFQDLAAYVKTNDLAPGASQKVKLSFPLKNMASYDTNYNAYKLFKGQYLLRLGNSSRQTHVIAKMDLSTDVTTQALASEAAPKTDPTQLKGSENSYTPAGQKEEVAAAPALKLSEAVIKNGQNLTVPKSDSLKAGNYSLGTANDSKKTLKDVYDGKISMRDFVNSLNRTQLSQIVEGSLDSLTSSGRQSLLNFIGAGGTLGGESKILPGASGETTDNYVKTLGIPAIVSSDGPAGLRLPQKYEKDGTTYYNYATAWPIGTLIAQTWEPEKIYQMGQATAAEMSEFGVTTWLAPGMNIQRDPLGGRNFEYFSEDPLIAGISAAAETRGVQATPGIGVTIKHFAANNQESNRMISNSVIGQQALREIYLKGFQIAVMDSQPQFIMSSYNKLNGNYTATNRDLLTDILRQEWGFNGTVMTDWVSFPGITRPQDAINAGNDLIMPGGTQGILANKTLTNKQTLNGLKISAARVLTTIMHSDRFAKAYGVPAKSATPVDVQNTFTANNKGW